MENPLWRPLMGISRKKKKKKNMPCPGPFNFYFIADYIHAFCHLSLTQMLVFLSLYVMLSMRVSILICATTSLFCACFVSGQVSAQYAISGSTHALYMCVFRQMAMLLFIPVFGVCCPACHDSSLYIFLSCQQSLLLNRG